MNDEDDDLLTRQLLKQQQEFLQSGEKSSASVVRGAPPPVVNKSSNSSNTGNNNNRSFSKFKTQQQQNSASNKIPIIDEVVERDVVSLDDGPGAATQSKQPPSFTMNPSVPQPRIESADDDVEMMLDDQDTHITSVISKIYERDVSDAIFEPPKRKNQGSFPVAVHRSIKSFSKERQQQQPPQVVDDMHGGASNINKPEDERKAIDKENSDKLSRMSEQEILESQQYLLKHLDPSLIAKLTKRAPQSSEAADNNNNNDPIGKMVMEQLNSEIESTVQPMDDSDDDDAQLGQQQLQQTDEDMPDWMKDLTDTDRSQATFKEMATNFVQWRFDFKGDVLKRGEDLPTHKGLHHHGDEAAEAGYTIIELVQLAKSTNISQISMSLRTLAAILHKIHRSYYPFKKSLLFIEMLKQKLPRLLRTLIDNKIPTVLAAATVCLHALIVPVPEEEMYEMIESRTHRAYEAISIKPKHQVQFNLNPTFPKRESEPDEELDDDERCFRDLLAGLVDIGLLSRVRYLLVNDALDTEYSAKASLLIDILIRMARHSSELAEEVVKSHFLIDGIRDNILSKPAQDPLLKAKVIRLLRKLCQASRELAVRLCSSQFALFDLVKSCAWDSMKHTTSSSTSTTAVLPIGQQHLLLESTKFFRVLALYHINLDYIVNVVSTSAMDFVQQFSDYINQHSYQLSDSSTTPSNSVANNNNNSLDDIKNNQYIQIVRAIYNMLDTLLFVIDFDSSEQSSKIFDKLSAFVEPAGIISHTVSVIYHSFKEHSSTHQSYNVIGLHSAIIHFVGSYFSIASSLIKTPVKLTMPSATPATATAAAKSHPTVLEMFEHFTNNLFNSIFSTSLYTDIKKRMLGVLPSQSTPTSSDTITRFYDGESCEWWLAIARYLLIGVQQNRSIGKLIFHMDKCDFFIQLHSILVSTIDYKSTHFDEDRVLLLTNNRSKTYLYYFLLRLMNELRLENDDNFDPSFPKFHHAASMSLVHNFLPHDDLLLYHTLQTVTLHPDYLELIGCTKSRNTSTVLLSFYQEKFLPSSTLTFSRQFQCSKESKGIIPQSLIISLESYDSLLPLAYDWYNTPLQYLYNESQDIVGGKNKHDDFGDDDEEEDNEDEAEVHTLVENTLSFLQALFNINSEYIQSIPLENVYQHMMMVFLIKCEPWISQTIIDQLTQIFNILIRRLKEEKSELEESGEENVIVEFDFTMYFGERFFQFFTDFIAHFMSASYSSDIFSNYVWIFLRQHYPVKFRKLVWSELFSAPQFLCPPLGSGKLQQSLPLGTDGYLEPIETDQSLLQLYKNAISQSKVTPKKASILYRIAKHHIIGHLFPSTATLEQEQKIQTDNIKVDMIKDILLSGSETSKDVLIDTIVGQDQAQTDQLKEKRMVLLRSIAQANNELVNIVNGMCQ
ncbi:hypothetical protein SAMD00019534_087110 [Acytostelium subglobosum LB1]|uniref:hypothetical protein n=1 Tax=Acytostelium subglobosum LB1 TaxID=1410327 RepID=UPI000644B845|nr:hypothetical protein SAMD00019534_087110 [Acytostelium subglobosum LB1]GAM25536.1 hypothetical protein SAMD00019534_087110 [Acytostelium subglobosum LB1]|eukprot:XP_012751522.1 hypothetical protein SAMD00019534_087110 [Acytostelium subglobosum LB1]